MAFGEDIEQDATDQCNGAQNPVLCATEVSGTHTTGKGISANAQQAETNGSNHAGGNDGRNDSTPILGKQAQ